MKKYLIFLVLIFSISEFAMSQNIRYVTPDGAGFYDGSSWDNAYNGAQLQAAIFEDGVTEVWVAAGTYKPTVDAYEDPSPEDPRTKCFQMKNGVAIYGGFAGWESLVTDRDWAIQTTTLSGNLDGDNYSYHVFYNADIDNTAILDGFTIQDGSAEVENDDSGGGMYNSYSSPTINNCAISWNSAMSNGGGMFNNNSSPIMTNCTFQGNHSNYGGAVYNTESLSPVFLDCKIYDNWVYNSGGGIYNESSSSPSFTNCQILDNSASNSGGGIYNTSSSPTLTSCIISGNTCQYGGGVYNLSSSPILTNCQIKDNSTSYDGGGVGNSSSSPTLINCLIVNNSGYSGGGVWNDNSSPTLTNCTISGNTATNIGGGILTFSGSPKINNSIIWGNTASAGNQIYKGSGTISLNYCCYSNGINDIYGTITPDTHCITTDPKFKYAVGADFRIFANSPCADAGYDDYNSESTDIRGLGFERKLSKTDGTPGTIDMGAYEYKFGSDPAAPQIIYVKELNGGEQNGKSWSTAYVSLQSALAEATGNTSIWVATGTYKPTTGTEPTIYFNMKNGVAIYGGFSGNGTETLLSERDWKSNVTILSGDIGTPGDNTDNSGHVIYNDHIDNTAILDGFTIQGGNAGIYRGGGMYNWLSSPTLANCTFSGNWGYSGGGVSNSSSSPKLTNCLIINNSAYNGGGVYNDISSSPIFTNCLIVNNMANSGGGGIFDISSSSTLINSTIANNAAGLWGGGVFNSDASTSTFSNSIIWGNTALNSGNQFFTNVGTFILNYSCYSNATNDVLNQNGTFAATNYDVTTDPRLLNPAGGDYRISGNSPCVNTGLNNYNTEVYDIRGQARIQNTTIDMGAYEWTSGLDPMNLVIYVDASKTGGANTGNSWDDAFIALQPAITSALYGNQIWVAAGTYKPTTGTDRNISFSMKSNVAIYGGFAGTETSLSQRNWTTHLTILSGDIGISGDNSDNSLHVIYNNFLNNSGNNAILDGFTIQGGNGYLDYGGGMYNHISSPTIINCKISGNSAYIGGGMYNWEYSSPKLINCLISGNTVYGSSGSWGGGIYNYYYSNPILTNCTLSGNSSEKYGGGIVNNGSCSPIINNSIIWGNSATISGNQIYIESGTTTLNYSCYSNGTNDVSIWSGGASNFTPDANCITTNPLFVNDAAGNYQLIGISNCVNKGNNGFNSATFDIRGQARIQNTTIDMGAYEWTSGTDPTGNLFTWTGTSSNVWDIPGNWNPATVPSGSDAATIPFVTTHFPEVSNPANSPALCYNLEVGSGGLLTVKTNGALTVNGTLLNDNVSGVSNIVVESGGSLITNSNPAATVERTIGGWIDANHGWHLLSSPVTTQSISTGFTDVIPANYDFYAWWELTNEWVNYKNSTTAPVWNTANVLGSTNGAGNFIPGKGYLVAYSTNSTKQFTGNLNNVKIQISGLAKSTGINRGWHLLGNPFPSALKWNDGNWALSQITGTAKIWKESVASYVDIAANGIIPAANGFMVETSGNGSLTIPLASRAHDATAFYKNTETAIKLVAHDTQNQTAQESIIKINNQATEYFNPEYDSHFLPGYAPQFYSVKDNENLSTNCLPTLFNLEIPMGFVKNDAHSFTIELDAGSMAPGQAVYLTDKKTGTITKLSTNPLYNFTSDEGDDVNRFILKFGTLGINDPAETGPLPVILQQDGRLYLQNIEKYNQIMVYDMQGRILQTNVLNEDASQNIGFNQPAGVYIVRLSNHNSFINTKIIVY